MAATRDFQRSETKINRWNCVTACDMDTSTIVVVVSDFIHICVEHPGMMIQIDDKMFKGIYRASVQPETCVREDIIIMEYVSF